MNNLEVLFRHPDRSEDEAGGTVRVDELQALVGPAVVQKPARARAAHTELSAVVGERQHTSRPASVDLADLTGQRSTSAAAERGADLATLVGSPTTRTRVDAGWMAPEDAQVGRRPLFGGRRKAGAVNILSVVAATIAVVALVGTASFAVFQRATANPADDAMVSLREREAELQNDLQALQTADDLYSTSVADAQSRAESAGGVLSGLTGRVAAEAVGAAESARTTLLATLAETAEIPVPQYSRAPLDEESFEDVGSAIDDVREARDEVPPLMASVRAARATVVSAVAAFDLQLRNLGAAIETGAAQEVARNTAAPDDLRAAVTDAAARVRAAQSTGSDGLSEMPGYATAVDALRAENERVLALRRAEAEERAPVRVPAPVTPPSSGGTGSPPSDGQTGGDTGGQTGGDTGGGTGGETGGGTGTEPGGGTGGGTGEQPGDGTGGDTGGDTGGGVPGGGTPTP